MSARINMTTVVVAVTMVALFNPIRGLGHDIDTTSLPKIVDEGCETACGPISCFVAARSLSVPVSLNEMVDKCQWKKGSLTTVKQLQEALSSFPGHIKSVPTRLTLDSLSQYLKSGHYVAVLPVRKNSQEINHAICFVGFEGGSFRAVDYPELSRTFTAAELADIWDGPVLLVSHSLRNWITANWPGLIFPVVVACGIMGSLTARRGKTSTANERQAPSSPRSTATLGFAVLMFSQYGCDSHQSAPAAASATKLTAIASPQVAAPSVSADKALFLNHDFGIVKQSEPVEHQFEIKNDRNVPIEFPNHQAGCACLTVCGPCVLPPLSRGSVGIRFNPRGLQGRVQRRMSIHSDDSSVNPVVMTMTATVAGVWPSPAAIDLGQLGGNKQSSGTIIIGAAGYPNARVESVVSQDPAIKVTLENAGPNEAARISGVKPFCLATVRWSGESVAPAGFSTVISFATNVPEFPRLDVSVVGYFKGNLEAEPPRIYFGAVGPGTKSRRSCTIHGDRIEPAEWQRLSVKVDHEFVTAAFSPSTRDEAVGPIMDVDLSVPENGVEGLVKGDLVVSEADGKFLFAVPYSVLVRDPR